MTYFIDGEFFRSLVKTRLNISSSWSISVLIIEQNNIKFKVFPKNSFMSLAVLPRYNYFKVTLNKI